MINKNRAVGSSEKLRGQHLEILKTGGATFENNLENNVFEGKIDNLGEGGNRPSPSPLGSYGPVRKILKAKIVHNKWALQA